MAITLKQGSLAGAMSYTACTPPVQQRGADGVPPVESPGLGVCIPLHQQHGAGLCLYATHAQALDVLTRDLLCVKKGISVGAWTTSGREDAARKRAEALYWACDSLKNELDKRAASLRDCGVLLHLGIIK